ncbi:hypothetical protein [Lacticaseibacillus pantheris]|nr:hypothetical protein [Lacticaseibacillus pantheris]
MYVLIIGAIVVGGIWANGFAHKGRRAPDWVNRLLWNDEEDEKW